MNGFLYLCLVGPQVYDEHKSVIIFNLLHGTLCRKRVLEDRVHVHFLSVGDCLARVLWVAPVLQCLWPVEDSRVHRPASTRVRASLLHLFGRLKGLGASASSGGCKLGNVCSEC